MNELPSAARAGFVKLLFFLFLSLLVRERKSWAKSKLNFSPNPGQNDVGGVCSANRELCAEILRNFDKLISHSPLLSCWSNSKWKPQINSAKVVFLPSHTTLQFTLTARLFHFNPISTWRKHSGEKHARNCSWIVGKFRRCSTSSNAAAAPTSYDPLMIPNYRVHPQPYELELSCVNSSQIKDPLGVFQHLR